MAATITRLRHVQAHLPLSTSLNTVGIVCIALGSAWVARDGCHLLRAHPYLGLIPLGLICFLTSILARPEGLLGLLSADTRKLLTRTTVYELVIDDAALHNFLRRWVRILLLSQANSEAQVKAIVGGLQEPDWVQSVLTRSLLEYLPDVVQEALLPTPVNGVVSKYPCNLNVKQVSDLACGAKTMRIERTTPLTTGDIVNIVRERAKANADRIEEPDLFSAFYACYGFQKQAFRERLKRVSADSVSRVSGAWCQLMFHGSQVLTISAVLCASSAALLCFDAPRKQILRGLSDYGFQEAYLRMVGIRATFIGVFSAGGAVIFGMLARRLRSSVR